MWTSPAERDSFTAVSAAATTVPEKLAAVAKVATKAAAKQKREH